MAVDTVCIETIALAASHKLGVSGVSKQRKQREARPEWQRSSSHELTRRLIAFPSRQAVMRAAEKEGKRRSSRIQRLHVRLASAGRLEIKLNRCVNTCCCCSFQEGNSHLGGLTSRSLSLLAALCNYAPELNTLFSHTHTICLYSNTLTRLANNKQPERTDRKPTRAKGLPLLNTSE